MATKKKKEAPSGESRRGKIALFLQNERTHFVMGLTLFMVGVFLFLAFLSFLFTGSADQSKLENLPMSELHSVKNEIQNWTGAIGAYLSNTLINKWIGISAFILCYFFGRWGLKLMKVKETSFKSLLLNVSILIVWSSLFFGFFLKPADGSFFYWGGYHGFYITELLEANLGWLGTLLIVICLTITILVIYSQKTVPFMRKILGFKLPKRAPKEPKATAEGYEEPKPSSSPAREQTPNPQSQEPKAEVESNVSEVANESTSDGFEVVVPQEEEMIVPPIRPQQKPVIDEPFEVTHHNEEMVVEGEDLGEYDPTLDLSSYKYPTFDLLHRYDNNDHQIDMEEQVANKEKIISTLENYGIRISSIKATIGPTITLYEIVPEVGIRIAKIRNLGDDIALNLAALGIRIIAPIPGKGTIGIEVPNKDPQVVSMQSVIASRKFQECKYDLPIALGKTITNEIYIEDLCKMPHVLVAGATGQGKSVGLNAIITSLLYKKHPSQLKFVLIDPKKVEFNIYSAIEKHFLATLPDEEEPIITDVTKVVQTLNSITKEMDNRYDLLKKAQTRNIKEYNAKFIARKLNPNNGHRYMPYIVVIIDEFGDLIMTAGKEVELPIARIAQLARAVGIHMIIATQRPSTNIITGVIKANFPARVAFRVSSMIDSRTILDCPGANQLIGRGDMLFSKGGDLERVQCAFVDTPEVEQVCGFIGDQMGYATPFLLPEYHVEGGELGANEVDLKERDPMFDEAARLIVASQQGSTSMIQRKFSIGYNRAGRLMDQLEAAGIVGPYEGSKARQVLVIDDMHLENILNSL